MIQIMDPTSLIQRLLYLSVLIFSHAAYSDPASFIPESCHSRHAPDLVFVDDYTLKSPVHLVDGINPVVEKNIIKTVIEIPAGSNQKWEVEKLTGNLKWEFKNNSPRKVKYLAYPANYGLVPMTILSKENGGDGDPLDILVLGPAVPRGSVVEAKIIGVLRLLDKGQQDDKLIAVMAGNQFYEVDTIKDLEIKYPGVTTIIDTWFANYKGEGKVKVLGFADRKAARDLLIQGLEDYRRISR